MRMAASITAYFVDSLRHCGAASGRYLRSRFCKANLSSRRSSRGSIGGLAAHCSTCAAQHQTRKHEADGQAESLAHPKKAESHCDVEPFEWFLRPSASMAALLGYPLPSTLRSRKTLRSCCVAGRRRCLLHGQSGTLLPVCCTCKNCGCLTTGWETVVPWHWLLSFASASSK